MLGAVGTDPSGTVTEILGAVGTDPSGTVTVRDAGGSGY